MNKVLLVFLILTIASFGYAQNKSLGVGTATPNPNAALHVESPTGNQGAIMPRLTTAQRTAMSAILGAPDAGLLLYDTDLKGLYIWDGAAWQSPAKISLPFKDSVVNATGTTDLFALKYNNAENKRVLRVENLNRNNGSSAVSISNNGSGLGLYVQNSNDTSAVSSVYVTNNSNNINANPGPTSIYAEATGTAGAAGSFRVLNSTNNKAAVYAETSGTGNSVFARHSGVDGHAGYFWVADTSNFSNPVRAQTDGIGSAARLEVTNPNNSSAALQINHYGFGEAINAVKTNQGGVATFQITDPTSTYNVLELSTTGNGYALNASTSGGQRAAYFSVNNPSSTAPAVSISSMGLVDALEVFGAGQGRAVNFMADSAAEVMQVRTDGLNTRGGAFIVNNASNAQPAIYAQNNGTGPALQLYQNNYSTALSIMQGGIQYSVTDVLTAGPISQKSVVYNVTASGSYTLTWFPLEGEAIYVLNNNNGASITFAGIVVPDNALIKMIYVGGQWRQLQ